MGWTHGKNGRGTADDESGCAQGGGRRGRLRLIWEDCVKRDLLRLGEAGRMRDEGVETEEENTSRTSIDASLIPDFRVKDEGNKRVKQCFCIPVNTMNRQGYRLDL